MSPENTCFKNEGFKMQSLLSIVLLVRIEKRTLQDAWIGCAQGRDPINEEMLHVWK